MDEKYISPKSFEQRFDIKTSTQKKLRAEGKLPYIKFGRFVKYDLLDIYNLFNSHKVGA
jgi:hypothetical protein